MRVKETWPLWVWQGCLKLCLSPSQSHHHKTHSLKGEGVRGCQGGECWRVFLSWRRSSHQSLCFIWPPLPKATVLHTVIMGRQGDGVHVYQVLSMYLHAWCTVCKYVCISGCVLWFGVGALREILQNIFNKLYGGSPFCFHATKHFLHRALTSPHQRPLRCIATPTSVRFWNGSKFLQPGYKTLRANIQDPRLKIIASPNHVVRV